MNLDLGSFRMVKGQKPDIKPKVFGEASDTAIDKEAEATVNASDMKHPVRFGCTQIEMQRGLLLRARVAPSFELSHKEDAR